MGEIAILREQVKKYVDEASENELELIYRFFEARDKTDWWNEIDAEHKAAIDAGLEQLDKGKGIPHDEVVKKYSKWL